ncbi:hypothetical protein GGX14DRAFT_645299 [Mycena pura]|uniref:Uncharacterized protein n=1 Tax=Mycena pura TaxID=153505 RepID=A0AAD6Y8G8_9AGAR|nr:hypothetical protein GGX14DRAFT_645299 [Mycena pura]
MTATYVGHMVGDANMSFWGDQWAREALANFDLYGTLAEFNSGTYTGVTPYALSLWAYMPRTSTIAARARNVIAQTWTTIGRLYNPTPHTLGGPWDGAYGHDMASHSLIPCWLCSAIYSWTARVLRDPRGADVRRPPAGLVGGIDDGTAPLPRPIVGSDHFGDAAANILTPLIAKFHDPYVPAAARALLLRLPDAAGHAYAAQAVSPPWDAPGVPRNYTAWTPPGLSIGGVASDEKVVGGPATNQAAYVPATIVWDAGGAQTAWFNVSARARAVCTRRAARSAPSRRARGSRSRTRRRARSRGRRTSQMTFRFGGFPRVTLGADFLADADATLPGLRLRVSGNVVRRVARALVFGASAVNGLAYYNLTYAWTAADQGGEVPQIVLEVEKT